MKTLEIKIWLDDIRPMPIDQGYNVHITKAYIMYLFVKKFGSKITFISFDHDLGTEKTGYDIAKEIEAQAQIGIKPPDYEIHSANPVGRKNIMEAMVSAERLYNLYLQSIKDLKND